MRAMCLRALIAAGCAAATLGIGIGAVSAQGRLEPLIVKVFADAPTSGPGDINGYTITIHNPNEFDVLLTSISDQLPPGFSYIPKSTVGLTLDDPAQSGGTLTWSGRDGFLIKAGETGVLRFLVQVARQCGTYTTAATATTAQGIPVTPSGPSAPIEVVGKPLQVFMDPSPSSVAPGEIAGYTIYVTNPNAIPVPLTAIVADLEQGFSYVPGSTTGLTTSDPAVMGPHLTWTAPGSVPASSTAFLSFEVRVPTVTGIYVNVASVESSDRCFAGADSGQTGRIVVRLPVGITKTPDAAQSGVGEINGYTITVANPNSFPESFDAFVDTFPPGFSYLPGTTSGATAADPLIAGQTLTWYGPFTVPETSELSLHFGVTVSSVPGVFTNDAAACSNRDERQGTCISTGPTARVTVVAIPLVTAKTADLPMVFVSETDGYTIEISNANAVSVDVSPVTDTLPDGFSYLPGTTSGATPADPVVTGQSLTWKGPFTVPGAGSISIHFNVRVSAIPGEYYNEAAGVPTDRLFEVTGTGPTARIEVLARPVVTTKTADIPVVRPGAADGYTIVLANPNLVGVELGAITDTLPAGFSYTPRTTTGATTADPAVSGQSLTWTGRFVIDPRKSLTLHFGVTAAERPGLYWNRAGGEPVDSRFSVQPTGLTAPVRVKGPTVLIANPALLEAVPGAVVFFPRLSATLSEDGTSRPIEGQRIVFSLGDRIVCRAATDIHGVAACGGLVEEVSTLLNLGYHAEFEGTDEWFGADDDGPLVEVADMELP